MYVRNFWQLAAKKTGGGSIVIPSPAVIHPPAALRSG